jgi:hypothetical protein
MKKGKSIFIVFLTIILLKIVSKFITWLIINDIIARTHYTVAFLIGIIISFILPILFIKLKVKELSQFIKIALIYILISSFFYTIFNFLDFQKQYDDLYLYLRDGGLLYIGLFVVGLLSYLIYFVGRKYIISKYRKKDNHTE